MIHIIEIDTDGDRKVKWVIDVDIDDLECLWSKYRKQLRQGYGRVISGKELYLQENGSLAHSNCYLSSAFVLMLIRDHGAKLVDDFKILDTQDWNV